MSAPSATPGLPVSHAVPPAVRLPVAVLGGGITGLTAADELKRAGAEVRVFEASARIGGAIGAHRDGDWLHELGPNSLLEGSADIAAFIDAVGLGARRLYAAEEAKKRYIVHHDRLVPMPSSPGTFATTPLFSLRAKLALLGEPWRGRGPAGDEETVAEFVIRRLGREFLDYAINPFVGGVYAGDPRRLSVVHGFPRLHALEQEHGSLLRGALARRNTSGAPKGRIFSFPEGLGELPRALGARLGSAVRVRSRVLSLSPRPDCWEVETETDGVIRTGRFAAVVCALPADAVAALAFRDVPGADRLRSLSEIAHPPVVSVFTGHRREDVPHPLDGFGALVPEVEAGNILGMLFSSTLFPGRAPAGHVGLTSFVGGMRQPELAELDDAGVLDLVRRDSCGLLGIRTAPVYSHICRWRRAIPQYAPGYGRFKDAFAAVEESAPGLFFGGNARDGISLANCIASGRRLAAAAAAFVHHG